MPAPPHIRPSKDKDAAAVLAELLKPGAWIPPGTLAAHFAGTIRNKFVRMHKTC
jgi:hypothetical protein